MGRIIDFAQKALRYIDTYPDSQPEACAADVRFTCSHLFLLTAASAAALSRGAAQCA